MRAFTGHIRRFARADSTVLIAVEAGTGKNAVALWEKRKRCGLD